MSGTNANMDDLWQRYSRQVLFKPFGSEGQRRLSQSRVALIGCGALGSAIADTLVRSGVGALRICDRDFVELNNLQRQTLFDESDVARRLPKAEAARRKLARINSDVTVLAEVMDVHSANIHHAARGVDLLLDGTDNLEIRYLVNDFAVRESIPWVYGGVIQAIGLCMPILPGSTPCLRCLFESQPSPGEEPTCDTIGVIAPAVMVVAALECVEALKILTGDLDHVTRQLTRVDLWKGRFVRLDMSDARREDCPCCGQRRFDFLDRAATSSATSLCGRNAVQIRPSRSERVDLAGLAARLSQSPVKDLVANEYLVQFVAEGHEITAFGDGRVVVKQTTEPERARALAARYLGM